MLKGHAKVLDSRGTTREAVLLERYVESAGRRSALASIDALDPRTGNYVWSLFLCPYPSADGGCPEDKAVYFSLDGHPGFLGRALFEAASGASADSPLSGALGPRNATGCIVLNGRLHPLFSSPLFGYYPEELPEGGPATFCPDLAWPKAFVIPGYGDYRLLDFTPGTGAELHLEPQPWRGRGVPLFPVSAPSAGYPAGAEWTEEPFSLSEAWSWAAANSAEFKQFVADHDDARLRAFTSEGGGRSSLGPPSAGLSVNSSRFERKLTVQAGNGDYLALELTKEVQENLGVGEISQISATPGTKETTVRFDAALAPMASRHDVTGAILKRLNQTWEATDVLSAPVRETAASSPPAEFYAYRVLANNAREKQVQTGILIPTLVVVRADTGELLYYLGAPELAFTS